MNTCPLAFLALAGFIATTAAAEQDAPEPDPLSWPAITKENMPGTRWWWMGSAVNPADLARELRTFRAAGLGTVEITPIYGVKGSESQFIEYLSPKWMEMLKVTTSEAQKLGMNVDMVTGTGWCFGGPNVGDQDANASAIYRDGAVSQKPSGVKVKRPAPGGEGWMLNLLYPDAMNRYLQRFSDAFSKYDGPKPHAQFHDSYEYKSDWAPDFFEQFEKRRGYKLQGELPALFESKGDPDHVARVKCDYRETVSDLIEESIARWTKWSHDQGSLSREQAHGSPGNWLDIYAASDIPETEMFYKDRDILVSKFASSAAHVTGKNLVGAETGTWVSEHFTETLADLKYLVDDMFLAGVNRITWHGTAYSPADAPWPGWCFYASTEMNPRNAIWRDVPALNAYIARVQSVLQSGKPDNDILLYWPIYDFWHSEKGTVQQLSVHARDWFDDQPVGRVARQLWERGYTFDYVSDKQLYTLDTRSVVARTIVVPLCEHMPASSLQRLLDLAELGFTVIFDGQLPKDVPGFGKLDERREQLRNLLARAAIGEPQRVEFGKGQLILGELKDALSHAPVRGEILSAHQGVELVRRVTDTGHVYFIANRGTQKLDDWISLNAGLGSHFSVLDPTTGKIGIASVRPRMSSIGVLEIHLQLDPGASIILRESAGENLSSQAGEQTRDPSASLGFARDDTRVAGKWRDWQLAGEPIALSGKWDVKFIEGGPTLPKEFSTEKLGSWTETGGEEAQSFGGTSRYTLHFDAPDTKAEHWSLDLGKVCQSARVKLNGKDLGTVFIPPFRVAVDQLKPKDNVLEAEVTSTSANRIRDLDVRGVKWKIFYDTNIVNLNYKPFDASKWPVAEAGLIGPVTLQAEASKQ